MGWRSPRANAWSPGRHAWRSAWRHRRGQALALVAISALVTACTTFAPVYDRAMQQSLVDTLLAQATPAEATVTLVSESSDFAGGTEPRDPQEPETVARGAASTVETCAERRRRKRSGASWATAACRS